MEYMTQLNRFFEKAEEEDLPASAQIVYLHLLNINNRLHWCEWFKVANSRLENLTKLKSNNSIVSAKNRLKQANLIDFKSEGKVTTRYKIIPISTAQDTAQDTAQVTAQDTAQVTAQDTAQDGAQVTAQDTAQLNRRRQRQKNIDICASAFAQFWAAYPKRKDKEKAQRAFAKLNPSQELLQKMLSAIQKSKMTDDWQKQDGQFIPYPATWLNGRRWEDEGVILESTPTLSPEEEERKREENKRRNEAAMAAYRAKVEARYGGVENGNGTSERSAS